MVINVKILIIVIVLIIYNGNDVKKNLRDSAPTGTGGSRASIMVSYGRDCEQSNLV